MWHPINKYKKTRHSLFFCHVKSIFVTNNQGFL